MREGSAAARATIAGSLFGSSRGAVPKIGVLALLLVAVLVIATGHGAVATRGEDFAQLLSAIFGGKPVEGFEATVLLQIRLPRVMLVAVVGAGLALSGAGLQGLFRNPLADPALIGVSGGAALGSVAAILAGPQLAVLLPGPLAPYTLPLAAFAGGIAATALVYRIATYGGQTNIATMLLPIHIQRSRWEFFSD